MFFAGLWMPAPACPTSCATIGDFTPLGAGVQALQDAAAGQLAAAAVTLAVLLACDVVVGGLAAARCFRWE